MFESEADVYMIAPKRFEARPRGAAVSSRPPQTYSDCFRKDTSVLITWYLRCVPG